MAVKSIRFGLWFGRVFKWDGVMPFCVLLIPGVVALVLPNQPDVIVLLAVVLPIIAFCVRLYVGTRLIFSNACSSREREAQRWAFYAGISILFLLDGLFVIVHLWPAGVPVANPVPLANPMPAAHTDVWMKLGLLVAAYLALMAIAMYPGRLVPEIDAALAEFKSNPANPLDSLDTKALLKELRILQVKTLRILPVVLDMGGCLGILSNGDVVSVSWDNPKVLRPVRDPRICNTAYHQASLKYSAMASLSPERPTNAIDCHHCGGSGRIAEIPAELWDKAICYCGGLGWLPSD